MDEDGFEVQNDSPAILCNTNRQSVHSWLSTCAPVFLIQQLHGCGTGGQPVSGALLTIDISFQLDKTQIGLHSNFSHFCKVKTTDKLVSESTRVYVCVCACVAILSRIYLYQHFL